MSLLHPDREDFITVFLVLVLVGIGALARAHNVARGQGCCDASGAPALETPIAPDANRRTGTLPNGLRYFIRANDTPEHAAELRLVVDAGSVFEDERQRGLAHAVEHMVFRGTRRFPHQTITSYFRSVGMRDGEDVNATTGPDETVFTMTVPTDRRETLDSAVAMLADMAHAATFEAREGRAEGGVVLEEWRLRHGAARRFGEISDSVVLAGSPYSTRQTIGDTAVLRRFDLREMRRFYADWYRPELMALVVVGDFDARDAERLIEREFGAIPASADRRVRPEVKVPRSAALRAATLADAEATSQRITLWFPRPAVSRATVGDYRARLTGVLWRSVLNARLDEATDQPGSPLLSAEIDRRTVARPIDADVVDATVADGRALPALDLVLDELHLLAQHGPTAHELARERDALVRQRRREAEWADRSETIADGYVHEFLTGDVYVDRETTSRLVQQLMPTITVADVRDAARRTVLDSGAIAIASGPIARRSQASPDELIARLRAAKGRPVTRVATAAESVPLMSTLPEPGHLRAERLVQGAGIYEWMLANGMRVIVQPTDHSEGHIVFRLVGTGGASLANDADYPSAYYSDAVVRRTGIGPYTGRRVLQLLDTTSIELDQTVLDDAVTLSGSAAPKDLETLFQLLHLELTAPRSDTAAFRRFRERATAFRHHRSEDPDLVFEDSVAATLGAHRAHAVRGSEQFIDAVSLSTALRFWRARTANAASFTLVMTGDIRLTQLRPLVARYLASLPAGVAEHSRDLSGGPPDRIVRRVIRTGAGPKARTQIVLSGTLDGTPAADEGLAAVREVAEFAIANRLREVLGGTYGVDASTDVTQAPPVKYRLTFDFTAAPERIDSLSAAALTELARLRTVGPTEAEFTRVAALRRRDVEQDADNDDDLADDLLHHARMGWPLDSVARHRRVAGNITRLALREACRRYLDASRYVQVTMLPKESRQLPVRAE